MNVFILCTGRCGSVTFVKACQHIENFTAAHESRIGLLGPERVNYPINHIEADNRLSWHLGRLGQAYGDNAFYLHLQRDRLSTAESYQKRYEYIGAIMPAYEKGILMNRYEDSRTLEVALDYCDTVNENIRLFLRDKTRKMDFLLENAQEDYREFWRAIGAQGNEQAALSEWETRHNHTVIDQTPPPPPVQQPLVYRVSNKMKKIVGLTD